MLISALIILCFYILLWVMISKWVENPILLPSPKGVLDTLWEILLNKKTWLSIFYSLWKIALGFSLGTLVALVLQLASFRLVLAKQLINPLIKGIMTVPIASFIVLAIIWIGSKKLAILISFLVSLPIVYLALKKAFDAVPKSAVEMCNIYNISFFNRIRHLYLPQTLPTLASSTKIALGMSIKAGIAGEIIATSDFSIGGQIYFAKLAIDTASIFAWTIIILLISWLLDRLISLVFKLAHNRLSI